MKTLSPSSNFLSLVVILLAFSFLNTFPTVFGKHNKAGGHHIPPADPFANPAEIIQQVVQEPVPPLTEPVVPPAEPIPPRIEPVVPPHVEPIMQPVEPVPPHIEPVIPPQPVVDPAAPRPDSTYEIHVLNHASAGADLVNVVCNPGPPLNGPPPPKPPSGPPVPPYLLKVGERFSWTFEYPDAFADVEYTCTIDWIGHNKGLVSFFDKDSYNDAICKTADRGNHCYWAIAPDGFYFSKEDAPFPGPAWTYRWPWGM